MADSLDRRCRCRWVITPGGDRIYKKKAHKIKDKSPDSKPNWQPNLPAVYNGDKSAKCVFGLSVKTFSIFNPPSPLPNTNWNDFSRSLPPVVIASFLRGRNEYAIVHKGIFASAKYVHVFLPSLLFGHELQKPRFKNKTTRVKPYVLYIYLFLR